MLMRGRIFLSRKVECCLFFASVCDKLITGMQPVLFSVTEACRGKPEWRRTGSSICYCRNTFCRNDSERLSDSAATRFTFLALYLETVVTRNGFHSRRRGWHSQYSINIRLFYAKTHVNECTGLELTLPHTPDPGYGRGYPQKVRRVPAEHLGGC